MTCPGRDKCLTCNVPDDKCSIVNKAQNQNIWKVVFGKITEDESRKDLNERFPGKVEKYPTVEPF